MLRIIKVQPTVGKEIAFAVLVSDKVCSIDASDALHSYMKNTYGEYVSIQYIQQFVTPVVDIAEYKVTGFVDLDSLIEFRK